MPNRDAVQSLMNHVMQPVTQHQLVREGSRVDIINGSGTGELSRVAADRLAWEGFVPTISQETASYQSGTVIYDYTGSTKGSSLGTLQAALRVDPANIVLEPNSDREVDFRVVLGGAYNSCTYQATSALEEGD